MRRIARVAVGGLVVLAGACPDAVADETHGDVNLPALTPEEIEELGLEAAPPSGDTVAPGSQDVDADQIPENQDTGAPAPEEAEPQAPEPAPVPAQETAAAPVPAAPVPAPVAPAPAPVASPPPAPGAAPPLPPPLAPVHALAVTRPPTGKPPSIGRQAPPHRHPQLLPLAQMRPAARNAEAAPVTAAPVTQVTRRHSVTAHRTVRSGESLWSIASGLLGPAASPARIAAEVERLWRLNRERIRTGDPDVLPAGVALIT